MKKKTFIYKDEVNDDFAGTKIEHKLLPDDYKYVHKNFIWRFFAFIVYRIIVRPLVFLYMKILFSEKIVGRKKIKKFKKKGFFLYANHTLLTGDAFTPSIVSFPHKAYIIVNQDATSIKGIRTLVEMLGGMPVPESLKQAKSFYSALKTRINERAVITVYPEAHIWPYYTKIRPFKDVSFKYPAQLNTPVFTFTRTFKKKKIGSVPKSVVYVDGPFFINPELSVKENQKYLRDLCYNAMKSHESQSTYSVNEYIKEEVTEEVAITE